jgi:hypothetical protein
MERGRQILSFVGAHRFVSSPPMRRLRGRHDDAIARPDVLEMKGLPRRARLLTAHASLLRITRAGRAGRAAAACRVAVWS